MLLPGLALYVVAVALILLGIFEMITAMGLLIGGNEDAKEILLDFTEVIDTFLLAAVAYVIGLGLIYLFVDQSVPLPRWLRLSGLDDLKGKLIAVVVAALAVGFFGSTIRVGATLELLYVGAASALIIAALGIFLHFTPGGDE
jgi:uncharacterized membrane protein YqhA